MSFMINPYLFAAQNDPDFASVGFLTHCDGTDGSTSFIDVTGKTITANGGVQIDTAQSQWGGASALFSAATSDYLRVAKAADFEFGSGDYTIEVWVKLSSIAATQGVIYYGKVTASTSNDYAFNLVQGASSSGSGLVFTSNNNAGGQVNVISNVDLTINTWQFIQVVHASGVTKIRLDGTEIASVADTITHNTSASHVLLIGRRGSFSTSYLTGWLDDIRITKGIARANAVPSAAFPDS